MMNNESVSVLLDSERLRGLRKQKKLKQDVIAQAMGISPSAYCLKESGKFQFKDSEKLILANLLGMSFEEFDEILYGGMLKTIGA